MERDLATHEPLKNKAALVVPVLLVVAHVVRVVL
jgi:hypothetical protein